MNTSSADQVDLAPSHQRDTNNTTVTSSINTSDADEWDGPVPEHLTPENEDEFVHVKFLASNSQCGMLIGRNGVTIQELQDSTRSYIKISHSSETYPGTPDRLVVIRSRPQHIVKAAVDIITCANSRPSNLSRAGSVDTDDGADTATPATTPACKVNDAKPQARLGRDSRDSALATSQESQCSPQQPHGDPLPLTDNQPEKAATISHDAAPSGSQTNNTTTNTADNTNDSNDSSANADTQKEHTPTPNEVVNQSALPSAMQPHDAFGTDFSTMEQHLLKTKAATVKLVIPVVAAGLLLGRGGETIRKLQTGCHAYIHISQRVCMPPQPFAFEHLLKG